MKKTFVSMNGDPPQCEIKRGDICFVDGYVRGANDVPYAVVIRVSDGQFDMVPIHCLKGQDDI